MGRRLASAAAAAAIASACAGCGSAPSEREVTEVVGRFETALAHGRGAVACAQLAPAARTALERDEGRPCPRAILALGLDGGGEVSRADVYMTSGYAEVGERAAFLDQTPQGWRIGAAGCTPTEPGLPYDCELED